MSDPAVSRAEAIGDFLTRSGWGEAQKAPLAGDASTRRYVRLHRGAETALLMDAPPRAESAPCPPGADDKTRLALGYNAVARLAGPDSRRFAAFAHTLRTRGLSAPGILAADYEAGLILLEDLGDDLFARVIARGAGPEPLYAAAIDVLSDLHRAPAPPQLGEGAVAAPLLRYDGLAYKAEVDLLIEWLYPLLKGGALSAGAREEWDGLWREALASLTAAAPVIVLRDYHAENLFWLPERRGLQRVGLIDFQDGLAGHAAYDLVSLLEDARRDVEPALAARMLDRYVAARRGDAGFEAEALREAYGLLGAQRNAKILGIFARLWRRDGKPLYLRLIPRVWRYMEGDLNAPGLARLKVWFDRHIPPELRIEPSPK